MSLFIKKIKSNLLLFIVIFAYAFLFVFMPDKGLQSLKNSLYYVKEMLIIMPVIFLLTSLIEAWVPKKNIQKALGENSGAKGFIFSFLLGSFSAGPIYAAFPVCKMLLKKGASIANIIIILSAWAVIKIPMLANEAKFLGPEFMAIRWLLTTISIFFMALITSKFIKKDEIPLDTTQNKEQALLNINKDFCIGCTLCAKMAPEYFLIENKKAKVCKTMLKSEENEQIKIVIEKCPAKAIDYK